MEEISRDILLKAAAGDLDSFEIVYKITSGFVYNVALRIVSNRLDAQEITQEVFVTIYNKLKTFRFEASFRTWVYRVTVNLAINFAKKTSKTRRKMVEYKDDSINQLNDTCNQINSEELGKIIDKLLGLLNPDQKACVVLRNLEGLTYQEIAQTLKININTVRSRLKRARERLLALKNKVGYEYV